MIASASSREVAIGFSRKIWQPCSAAATTGSEVIGFRGGDDHRIGGALVEQLVEILVGAAADKPTSAFCAGPGRHQPRLHTGHRAAHWPTRARTPPIKPEPMTAKVMSFISIRTTVSSIAAYISPASQRHRLAPELAVIFPGLEEFRPMRAAVAGKCHGRGLCRTPR